MIAALGLWLVILLFVVVLVRTSPSDSTGARPLLTAQLLVALLLILYVLVPGLALLVQGGEFFWAKEYGGWQGLVSSLGIVVLGVGFFGLGAISWRSDVRRSVLSDSLAAEPLEQEGPEFRGGGLEILGIWMLLFSGLALKLYLVASTGGVENMLLRLSPSVREASGVAELTSRDLAVRTLSGVAEVAATWALVRSWSHRRLGSFWIVMWCAVIFLTYATAAKRLVLLWPLLAVVLAVHYYRFRLTARLFPLLVCGAFLAGMGTLFFRIFVPASIHGATIDLDSVEYANGSTWLFYLNSLEFSSVEMMAVVVNSREALIGMFGDFPSAVYELFVAPFLYTVPRAMWPGKPDAVFDLSYAVSAQVQGIGVAYSRVGYITTFFGNSFLLGGIFGVALVGFLFGLACKFVDRAAFESSSPSPSGIIGRAFALMLVFHFFRMGTLGWTFLIGVVQQYGWLLGWVFLLFCSSVGGRWGRGKGSRLLEGSRVRRRRVGRR